MYPVYEVSVRRATGYRVYLQKGMYRVGVPEGHCQVPEGHCQVQARSRTAPARSRTVPARSRTVPDAPGRAPDAPGWAPGVPQGGFQGSLRVGPGVIPGVILRVVPWRPNIIQSGSSSRFCSAPTPCRKECGSYGREHAGTSQLAIASAHGRSRRQNLAKRVIPRSAPDPQERELIHQRGIGVP